MLFVVDSVLDGIMDICDVIWCLSFYDILWTIWLVVFVIIAYIIYRS